MNKKTYTGADIEVILFPQADVLTASSNTENDETPLFPAG